MCKKATLIKRLCFHHKHSNTITAQEVSNTLAIMLWLREKGTDEGIRTCEGREGTEGRDTPVEVVSGLVVERVVAVVLLVDWGLVVVRVVLVVD